MIWLDVLFAIDCSKPVKVYAWIFCLLAFYDFQDSSTRFQKGARISWNSLDVSKSNQNISCILSI